MWRGRWRRGMRDALAHARRPLKEIVFWRVQDEVEMTAWRTRMKVRGDDEEEEEEEEEVG